MKRKLLTLLLFFIPVILVGILMTPPAHAAFNANNIIDDAVFNNSNTMTAAQIDTWLNQFPSSCISPANGFTTPEPIGYTPSGGYAYGGNVSAGTAIYDVSKVYSVNPQVFLSTFQKEQSLITGGAGCYPTTPDPNNTFQCNLWGNGNIPCTSACPHSGGCINIALGNNCPGNCQASTEGFSKQLVGAAWKLKYWQQRSEGNVGWNVQVRDFPHSGNVWDNSDDVTSGSFTYCYSGLRMTQGYFQLCPNGAHATYDGLTTINSGGLTVHLDNGATAALYNYTPFTSGNTSFDNIFQGWFGSTSSLANVITMRNISQPDTTPALGQTVSYTVSFTNNLSDSSVTLDAVGIVGRLGDVNAGANRDFGWQGPVTISAGATQQFTFTTVIRDIGTIYAWPAIYAQGNYTHYNNWGASLNSHIPNLGATITQTTTSPVAGQSDTLSTTIHNYEGQDIKLDAAGIPVRFFGQYSYDAAWSAPITIPVSGSSSTISGPMAYDKSGPYTEWVSVKIGGNYITVSPVVNITASPLSPSPQSIQLSYTTTPDPTPALGEDVTVSFNLKNSYGVPVTLDAVGIVGRYDSPYTGANRDFGWQGPETFAAGQTKSYSFTNNISDVKNLYAWVAIRYQGGYIHYNNWGFMLTPHMPDLALATPVTVHGGTQPTLNQSTPVIATIKNNESHPIKYSAIGLPARYYGVYNYDVTWSGAGTLAASGQTGDHVDLSGNTVFDKPGPYTLWASIYIQGRYITVDSQKTINL